MIATNKFYCIDSDNEFLARLQEEGQRFDLILTDPPYNLNKDFGNSSDSLQLNDFLKVNRARIFTCAQLLTPSGSMAWFAIHHFVGFLQIMMYEAGLNYRRMNIWRYQNGFSRSARAPRSEYEPFLWFSASPSQWTFNADDVRIPYKSTDRLKTPVYYQGRNGNKVAWVPSPLGSMRGDIWEFPTLAGKRFAKERTSHPTQKPEALITEIIKAFCPKDDHGRYAGRILDPYAGSGTVGLCCEKLNAEGHNIEWICAELEPRWVQISEQRLAHFRNTSPKLG
jgi:site-specific DNA-methyltransferase (adenine-specific)